MGVSCAGDRTVRVFDVTTDAKLRDANPPYVRCTIEGDSVSAMDFSGDGNYLIAAKEYSRTMLKLKIARDTITGKTLQIEHESDTAMHKNRVRWLVASKGNWAITCSEEDDTDVKVWNFLGDLLASFNTQQVKNFQMTVSPIDGRFVGVAAWSPGVKVKEVITKNGEFNRLDKAMDLKSPKGLRAVCFSADNTRAFTVDKGGLLALWNVDVRYQVSEDPKIILTYEETDPRFANYSIMAFSRTGKQVVAVSDNNIKIMIADKPEEFQVIERAHAAIIETLAVSNNADYFVTGAADNRPRIWRMSAA